jgi:hypothetical protein
MFEGELDKQWTFHNLGGGGIGRSNARDGTFETLREPAEKPPGNYIMGPDGNWMLNPLVGQVAAAKRAPARASSGGKTSAPGPKPTGRKF